MHPNERLNKEFNIFFVKESSVEFSSFSFSLLLIFALSFFFLGNGVSSIQACRFYFFKEQVNIAARSSYVIVRF